MKIYGIFVYNIKKTVTFVLVELPTDGRTMDKWMDGDSVYFLLVGWLVNGLVLTQIDTGMVIWRLSFWHFLLEEDVNCPSVHYFEHEQARE